VAFVLGKFDIGNPDRIEPECAAAASIAVRNAGAAGIPGTWEPRCDQYNRPMSSASWLYSATQVRALDAHAIAQGTDGYTLMRRAAEAALRALRSRWPTAMRLAIVTGGGNNGGDGYVLARFAQAAGLSVTVLAAVATEGLRGDARRACDDFKASSGHPLPFDIALLASADVIVDALLGTGLKEPVRPAIAAAIGAINGCGRPVFSLDLPSGLNADSGAVMGRRSGPTAPSVSSDSRPGCFWVTDPSTWAGCCSMIWKYRRRMSRVSAHCCSGWEKRRSLRPCRAGRGRPIRAISVAC